MKKLFAICAPVALLIATCWSLAPSRSASGGSDWLARVAADRVSSAGGDAALQEQWRGVNGNMIRVAVAAPHLAAGAPTVTIDPATPDVPAAFSAALSRLSAVGGGTLRLKPGTYRIDNASDAPGLLIDGAKDVVIDGAGAKIVFARWGDGIVVRDSQRVALRGMTIGYAGAPVVAAQVKVVDGRRLLQLADGGALPTGSSIYQISRQDQRGPGYLANEHRLLLGRAGERAREAGSNRVVIDNPALSGFADGTPVELKLSYYKGAAVRVLDTTDSPTTQDLTISGITVMNSGGAGIVADYMGRGLAIVDSTIGSSGSARDTATIAYDGIHVTAAAADILVRNNRITGTGDDAINLASPIYAVSYWQAGGRQATIAAPNFGIGEGVSLALFDDDLGYVTSAKIASRGARSKNGSTAVTFTTPAPSATGTRLARRTDLLGNRYAIVGNRIDHCSCHGVLTQGPNGVIRDNLFFNLRANAIRVMTSAMWKEGAGAYDLTIERNRIQRTGSDDRRGLVWAAITIFADGAQAGGAGQAPVLRSPIHSNIAIRNNDINGVAQGCVSVASATLVRIGVNRCRDFNQAVEESRVLVERAVIGDGLRRMPAKAQYLARGDGMWFDPLSTSAVSIAPGRQ